MARKTKNDPKEQGRKKSSSRRTRTAYKELIRRALVELGERNGSSIQAIRKFLETRFNIDLKLKNVYIKKALFSAIEIGSIVQTKGIGLRGRFRIAIKKSKRKSSKSKRKSSKSKAKVAKATASNQPKPSEKHSKPRSKKSKRGAAKPKKVGEKKAPKIRSPKPRKAHAAKPRKEKAALASNAPNGGEAAAEPGPSNAESQPAPEFRVSDISETNNETPMEKPPKAAKPAKRTSAEAQNKENVAPSSKVSKNVSKS